MEDAGNERINLNASDDDDDEGISYDDFKIRPQFQGPHGQELLELNTKLPERFKLDERFAEFFETEDVQEPEIKDGINEERDKNIRILQSVLGHEVNSKSTEKKKSLKRQVRFDPDDENTSHLVKIPETEQTTKPKKKKKVEIREDPPIPISTERYVEVCPDLKEVLNSASPFSFSKQFAHNDEEIELTDEIQNNYQKTKKYTDEKEDTNMSSFKKNAKTNFRKESNDLRDKQILPKSTNGSFKFFIEDGDPRLKEGIEFFKRSKPLNEIREEWSRKRKFVLELFRKKKKSSQRSHTTRVQTMQNKFAIRRQNFKR